jgi:catechol 2,3-dioxygenase-like lactoylglutathione lyase family enzyme
MRFDHAVVLVSDLDRASADYRALGFTVTPGGVHKGGATRNALIVFADDSYIELLAFTHGVLSKAIPLLGRLRLGALARGGASPMDIRFRERALGGEGMIDLALRSDSFEADLERLRREGIRAEGPIPGGRTTMDGEAISWQIALPAPKELPFLCADITDRELRVPTGPARDHANGVVGVAAVTVAVRSVETSSARYRALLGMEPDPSARERLRDARGRIFRLGGTELIVASSTSPSHPIRRQLRRRGEGPHSLLLRVAGGSEPIGLNRGRTHGLRLEVSARATDRAA